MRRMFLAAVALGSLLAGAAQAEDYKIMAPAAPGGGWDQTARSMQTALQDSGVSPSVQVTNVPGAGGTIGLAQFVNQANGDPSQLIVGGYVMVGAILTNNSPVTLDQVTPIARLTGEYEVVVVPTISPLKDMAALGQKLAEKGWADTYLAGDAFAAQLNKDTEATGAILKDIGLVQ